MRNRPIPPATAIGVLFVATLAIGCARPSPTYVELHGRPPVQDIQRITLEYLGCEGHCPVYTIELHRSGEAHYWGKALVSKLGHYIGVVDSTVFERLAAGLVDRGFFDSTRYPPAILPDASRHRVCAQVGADSHCVERNGGPGDLPSPKNAFDRSIAAAAKQIEWQFADGRAVQ